MKIMEARMKKYQAATAGSETMATRPVHGETELMASKYCLAPCTTSGCVGVCQRVLDDLGGHAGYKHHCAAGHEW